MLMRLTVALLVVLSLIAGVANAAPVDVRVSSPVPGEVVRNKVHLAPIRGVASSSGEGPAQYDVMIAIDVSQSTDCASGVDVDGDGVVGINPKMEFLPSGTYPENSCNTDAEDSILSAEIAAARALIRSLEPGRVRLGLLTFSGEVDPISGERARLDQQDAWLEVPLGSDWEVIDQALAAVLAKGPHGATNFAAGVRLGIRELAGLSSSVSQPRNSARKLLLFLTDGRPTFPIGKGAVEDPGDVEAAINASRLAHKASVAINTYALGPQALTYPLALTEMARVTLGAYTPVQNPGDIIALLQGVSFANVDDVVFTNLTTGDFSTDVRLMPDGGFSGFVPVKEGKNRVRITALGSDGSRESIEIDVNFAVSELSDRELARELERIRQRNKELRILLERKRIDEFRQREEQRKELEITPERPNPES